MAIVNKGVQDRGTEEGYVPETLFTQDEESTASPIPHPPSSAIPPNNHLLQKELRTQCRPTPLLLLSITVGTMRRPPPPKRNPTTSTILLPLPDPQTDTSFIEILWCSNPQLPPGAIMDSLRQPFPARLDHPSLPGSQVHRSHWREMPRQCRSCHIPLLHTPNKPQNKTPPPPPA